MPLAAPTKTNAAADQRAPVLGRSRPEMTSTSGSATQGRTAPGSTSALRVATCPSTLGFRPYAMPASQAGHTPSPSAAASRRAPSHPTTMTATDHSRSVTHGARLTRSPTRKNGPWGKRYPYAWFCSSPNETSGFQSRKASRRNSAGASMRGVLVSLVVCPGFSTKAAARTTTYTITVAARAWCPAGAGVGRARRTGVSSPLDAVMVG